jgi:hypothetical protein
VGEKAKPVPQQCAICKWLIFEKTPLHERPWWQPARPSTVGLRRRVTPAFPQALDFRKNALSARADTRTIKYALRRARGPRSMRASALFTAYAQNERGLTDLSVCADKMLRLRA